jgi:hypothetical protein
VLFLFWLSIKDVLKLAFNLAEEYKLPHTFYKETNLEAKNGFMHLCENSSIVCSATRGYRTNKSKRFQQGQCTILFDLLENNIAKFGFTPDKIFNEDDSGFITLQQLPPEIVAQKGKHQVRFIARANEESRAQHSYDTLRLVVYRQSVRYDDKPLGTHDQYFFFSTEQLRS